MVILTVTHTHVVVRDTPPPAQTITVGRLYPIGSDTVFKTQAPQFTSDEDEVEEKDFDDDVETKVMRRGRRPQPKANEDIEAK